MYKSPRTPRTKSGGIRPLGSLHLAHGVMHNSHLKNDPALHINQLHVNANPTSAIDENKLALKEKEFKEKEKKFFDQINSLEKLLEQLRKQLKEKSVKCTKLESDVVTQALDYENKLTQSEKEFASLKEELERATVLVQEKDELLIKTTSNYEIRTKEIIDEYETKLNVVNKSKEEELNERDERMNILKKRMAVSLGKNSQERQVQLEELKKDLLKQAQEARQLQHQLKQFQLRPCENCAKLLAKLEEKTLQLRLKEKTISDLQNIGKKMQTQLNQQDVVLQKLEERNNNF